MFNGFPYAFLEEVKVDLIPLEPGRVLLGEVVGEVKEIDNEG